jgi:hypothetical protein
MVFNATFNNISVISWQSVLLMEETKVPGDYRLLFQTHRMISNYCSISNLKDENKVLLDFDSRCLNVLSDMEVCEQDVIDIISTLNVD